MVDKAPPGPSWKETLFRAGGILLLVIIVAWAWTGSDFQLDKLFSSLPRMADFFSRMFPPDMTVAKTVFLSTTETIQIALFGSCIG